MFGVYHLTESANILMLSRPLSLETFFYLIFVPVHVVYPSVAILSHIPTQYQAIFVTYHESYNFPFILAKYIARGLQLFAFTDTQTPPPTNCCTLQLDATSCTRVGHLGHWGRAEQCRHDPDATVGRSGRRHRPSWSKLPSAAADREQSCENMWRDTSALDSTYWWLSPC